MKAYRSFRVCVPTQVSPSRQRLAIVSKGAKDGGEFVVEITFEIVLAHTVG